jgi:hypothetical protein
LTLKDSKWLKDIEDALKFGNHTGANQQQELLLKLVKGNVVRGFALPLPLDKIKNDSRCPPCHSQHPTPEDDQ